MADPTNSGYVFTHKYRGCALIIVNGKFWKNEGGKTILDTTLTRGGSSKDCKKMKAMFKALDFKVKVFKDLTAAGMENKIRKASQNKVYNKQSDCFALVISTHGEEVEEKKTKDKPKEANIWRHRVLGSDCNAMYIDDMMKLFKDDVAVELAGKPKLFIIQACRTRHGPKTRNFDYGVNILVSAKCNPIDKPSDAGDFSDGKVQEMFDNFGDVEDVNADWKNDSDDDEWNSDTQSESSDEESADSDQDLSDAKADPDSGVLPPSPDGELSPPALPSLSEVPPQAMNPPSELNTKKMPASYDSLSDAKGSTDSGVMLPSSVKSLAQPALPSSDEKHPVNEPLQGKTEGATNDQFQPVSKVPKTVRHPQTPEDKPDIKGGSDTGRIPQSPYNIVPIICPNDCILVYPVMTGYFAFRRADLGSRLLHCMQKKENFQILVQGCNFLQYMTSVSRDMARVEIQFEPSISDYTPQEIKELKENMPFKVTANLVHRLQGKVFFEPKKKKSVMSAFVEEFKKRVAKN